LLQTVRTLMSDPDPPCCNTRLKGEHGLVPTNIFVRGEAGLCDEQMGVVSRIFGGIEGAGEATGGGTGVYCGER
jgi:hypothetical protein